MNGNMVTRTIEIRVTMPDDNNTHVATPEYERMVGTLCLYKMSEHPDCNLVITGDFNGIVHAHYWAGEWSGGAKFRHVQAMRMAGSEEYGYIELNENHTVDADPVPFPSTPIANYGYWN